MVLLMLFALLAGAATALSPCVLPVLPAVLGAGVTGGRRRPLGVVTGLVALVHLRDGRPRLRDRRARAARRPDPDARDRHPVRASASRLLIPGLGDRIEAFGSRIAPGPARVGGDGFGSGLLLGASLGLVYAPCAGPILAGVITVSAAQDFTAGKLAVALAYALGSGVVLYVLMLGGRRLVDRLQAVRAPGSRPATGAVDGHGRGRDDRRPRSQVPERDRRRPAVGARQPERRARGLERRRRRPRRGPRRPRRGAGGRRRAGGGRLEAARLRPGARLRRHRGVVQHRRRAALDRRADRARAGWC